MYITSLKIFIITKLAQRNIYKQMLYSKTRITKRFFLIKPKFHFKQRCLSGSNLILICKKIHLSGSDWSGSKIKVLDPAKLFMFVKIHNHILLIK